MSSTLEEINFHHFEIKRLEVDKCDSLQETSIV